MNNEASHIMKTNFRSSFRRITLLFFFLTFFSSPLAIGAGPLEETFVREIPCGNLLAKITLLESCEELEKFFSRWEPRAQQCDPLALTLIGLKYYQHERTKGKALNYFTQAAEQGFAPAQLELGMLCEKGLLVSKNNRQAYLWLSLAAAQGEGKAVTELRTLERSMPRQEIEDAKKNVEKWRPKPCAPPCSLE